MSAGPLSDQLAGTFLGGRCSSGILADDTILYRAGTKGTPLGQFFTREPPAGVLQTRIDQAVLPEWPSGAKSPLDTYYAVKIPAGTPFHVGEISSQGGMYVGGSEQILIEKPWLLDGVQVVGSGPLK